jgi:hypothetical protein
MKDRKKVWVDRQLLLVILFGSIAVVCAVIGHFVH